MFVIAVTAVICAADSWADVYEFGLAKLKWFKTFLDLPHGIPSADTFERVFSRLDPDAFERCFTTWTQTLSVRSAGSLVAIDGKRIRRSFEHAWSQSSAAHLVSAFAADNAMVFAQVALEEKENEITGIPRLLELLDLRGATVTIDAIGCQTAIAEHIVTQGGEYVLCAKDNQPHLARALRADLDDLIRTKFAAVPHDVCETIDGDHGRIETRRVWTTSRIDWLGEEQDRWPGLRSVAVVESTRDVPNQGVSHERRYYISTLDGTDAKRMAHSIRGHWGIENKLHYVLDVSFAEDLCRVRKGHAAENLSRIRRIALNLLRRETTKKRGIKGKRLLAGWDHDYLLKLLTG
jgi:predicted transposase YbfD/YdcC